MLVSRFIPNMGKYGPENSEYEHFWRSVGYNLPLTTPALKNWNNANTGQ